MWSYRGHFLLETVKGDILTQEEEIVTPTEKFGELFLSTKFIVSINAVWWTLMELDVEVDV